MLWLLWVVWSLAFSVALLQCGLAVPHTPADTLLGRDRLDTVLRMLDMIVLLVLHRRTLQVEGLPILHIGAWAVTVRLGMMVERHRV